MYQNGLVRVSPQADATGNIVGIAVTEAVVISSPEEICPEMCPRILGPALMSTTSCAFVGNAPEYSNVSFVLTTQLQTDAELRRLTKHQRAKILFPAGSFYAWCSRPNVHLKFRLSSCVCSEAE